jgi:hypothetical protein
MEIPNGFRLMHPRYRCGTTVVFIEARDKLEADSCCTRHAFIAYKRGAERVTVLFRDGR